MMRASVNAFSIVVCAVLWLPACAYGEDLASEAATEKVEQAAVVENTTVRGSQIAVFVDSTETITCADMSQGTATLSAFISGGQFVDRTPGGPPNGSSGTFVEIHSYTNSCTGENVSFAIGGVEGGVFGPTGGLSLGAISGSGEAGTLDEQPVVLPFTLDITVRGTGPISSSTGTTVSKDGQCGTGTCTITIERSASRNRAGAVTGTVTVAGVEFTVDGSSSTMSLNAGTTITVSR